ncbi:hypothetical protein [Vibrio sp. D431a]|uniref:hypothetical protein n=1 Tax=Vibrio sp. D431a TaxID=2837388 RepID=UPI002552E2A7|nr:hypothetical protein [Vibrio sp. D431a]MDK9793225.1 hypothetical protein [Vibrio sp. D431a]
MSILATLLGKKDSNSASMAKKRLSLILHNSGNSELSRKLEERIKKTVIDFYAEEGLADKINVEDLEHHLKEEWMEFSIPLLETSPR